MGRYIGPSCRLCRSEHQQLFLKGDRCLSAEKCPITKKISSLRKRPPGEVKKTRLNKLSNYGMQLREKQRVKRIYGVLERQFKRFYSIAEKKKGVTGLNLINLLEFRLDNIIYRMHFASSRKQARQLIRHEHVLLNGRKMSIPSHIVKINDDIEILNKSKKFELILQSLKRVSSDGVISWLSVDADKAVGKVLSLPIREEIPELTRINEQLIVELYSK